MSEFDERNDPAGYPDDPELQQREIERVMEPLVPLGEGWLIAKDEDGLTAMRVGPDETDRRSVLQQTHPRLYGALLCANERVNDSFGCGLMSVGALSILLPCLGLHWQLFHHFVMEPETQRILEGLRSWWVYGIIGLVGFTFWIKVDGWIEGMAYQSERAELEREVSASGLDPLEVVAQLEGDSSTSVIAKRLKTDTSRLS